MTHPNYRLATNSEIRDPKLTVKDIAAHLGVSRMTTYRLIHDGELRAIKVGRSFRIPLSAFREYLGDAGYVPGGAE